MGFPPKFAEGLVSANSISFVQVYQFYKKYQDEHEKKFPSKGEALAKRWDQFKKDAEEAKLKAATAPKVENTVDGEVEETKD